MPFQKGNKLSKGRPKGVKNVASLEKKELITFLKDEGSQKFIQELMTLEGAEYCKAYIPVVEIAFPKLARTEITGKDGGDINVNITNDQAQRLAERAAKLNKDLGI